MTSLICSFVCCGFVMDCQRGRLLGHKRLKPGVLDTCLIAARHLLSVEV